jgi:hypothetical protein
MSAVFSNGMLARFAVFLAIGVGATVYSYLGLAHLNTQPRLSPILAGALSYCAAAVVFYLAFGLLSMHWFGMRYWVTSAVWGVIWLSALYALGREWLEAIGLAFAFLTILMIGNTLPKGGLSAPGDQ